MAEWRQSRIQRGLYGLLLLLCGCGTPSDQADNPPVLTVTADARQSTFRLKDFAFFVHYNYPELTPPIEANLHANLFDRFREDVILSELARFYGLRVTSEDISHYQQENPLPPAPVASSEKKAPDPDLNQRWNDEIIRRLSIRKLVQAKVIEQTVVTEEEVQGYFQANPDAFKKGTQYKIRVFASEVETEAAQFRADLVNATPMETLVTRYPQAQTFQLATPLLETELLVPFRSVVSLLEPGGISEVIPVRHDSRKTEATFYVVQLDAVIPPVEVPYEEVRDLIKVELQKQRVRNTLDTMRQKYEQNPAVQVQVHTQNLPFTYSPKSKDKEV